MGFFANIKKIASAIKKGEEFEIRMPWEPKAMTTTGRAGGSRFYGQKYPGGLPSPGTSIVHDHAETRNQVRLLSHNSLQMRAMIERNVDSVIAQGLNLSPEPKYKILGQDPEKIKNWITDTKTRFELWAMSQRSNRSGRYNFFQAQRLMEKCLDRDGELFVLLSYHNDSSLLSPLRFEILDPDQIRENAFTWTRSGASVGTSTKEGIIRNDDGEEIAYKVWTKDGNSIPKMTEIPRIGRSGRIMMLHAMTSVDYAGQLRGMSPYSVCAQDLELLTNYTLALANKANNQANIAFTVESETNEPAINPFRPPSLGISDWPGAKDTKASDTKASNEYGSEPKPSPDAKNVTEESLQPVYTPVQHYDINIPGGVGVYSLPGKQKLKPFSSTSPTDSFNTYVDGAFAYIAAARGQTVETVLMRFNNNYSASRATLILAWRIIEQRRWELDYYILDPIYEMWLSEEIAAGRKNCPGWLDPILKGAWKGHRFNGLSMPNIDPLKTMNAAKGYASLGATTLDDIAIEHNDSDAESNRIKLKQELAELREIGAMPWENKVNTGSQNSDKKENDDE